MKKFINLLLTAIVLFVTATTASATTKNTPLKILGIGNSFTDDGMIYLPDMLADARIDDVVLGRLCYGGCSLKQHYDFYRNDSAVYVYSKSTENKWHKSDAKATFTEVVAGEDWDVVVLQQSSGLSGMYETFQPYLDSLIAIVHRLCPNPDVEIAWQMTWAYSLNYENSRYENYNSDQAEMYDRIVEAVGQVVRNTEIRRVIPSGAAIQRLRATALNDQPLELTRDGYHLDKGIGRYTAACCWFETFIPEARRKSVVGNGFRVQCKTTAVTDDNARTIQRAARKSCRMRFR